MNADFQTIVKALWSGLKLAPPIFREAGSIVLQIDSQELKLSETPDGMNVQISGLAGRLAKDPGVQQRQVKMLLEQGLAQLVQDDTCVVLREASGDGREITVLSLHPCLTGETEALMRRIEQVLARVEALAARLETGTERAPQPMPRGGILYGDEMILRP